jgi:phytoene dehydrogenase-like protein
MAVADHVIVENGIDAPVAAALSGHAGHKAIVLERNDRIGGCILTEVTTYRCVDAPRARTRGSGPAFW